MEFADGTGNELAPVPDGKVKFEEGRAAADVPTVVNAVLRGMSPVPLAPVELVFVPPEVSGEPVLAIDEFDDGVTIAVDVSVVLAESNGIEADPVPTGS